VSDFLDPSDDFTVGDIVVDLPHRELVEQRLRDTTRPLLRITEVVDSEALGLSRIHLEGVPEFGADKGFATDDSRAIQLVLDELRRGFAAQFDGWVPEMEANPTVTGIVGFPHTKPMAFTPDLMTAPSIAPIEPNGAGDGVRVAVLDTGLLDHPALKTHATAATPGDLIGTAEPLTAWLGHGTFVAGLIAQRAPGCEIVVHRVLNSDGRATTWDTAVALAALADERNGYAVVNLSLGCRLGGPTGPLALRRAVQRHAGRALVVAAAGNHGASARPATPAWPAAFPGVVAVGTNFLNDGQPVLSEISPRLPWVDCVAVGSGVTSTFLDGSITVNELIFEFDGFATWSGTSFAAAAVSGAVAAALRPDESPAAAYARLLDDPTSGVSRFRW